MSEDLKLGCMITVTLLAFSLLCAVYGKSCDEQSTVRAALIKCIEVKQDVNECTRALTRKKE
ncbi:hypothetical protein UFOVP276_14 [uncultured Caudovirales phage]|uniref:Uncharacterized protein n=1 Tax=uncultured Caudovirales phage TaxID=2100421 RepID=A0A6J5LBW5_9CAUD|nr:hypothetical protein UFOVP127_151 [uncultured Caudovirales phage]CAB4134803.1 hypothetical protein UFOVP276_14 [uncultured Caudovirales phage]